MYASAAANSDEKKSAKMIESAVANFVKDIKSCKPPFRSLIENIAWEVHKVPGINVVNVSN